jgi:hypothetical protein
MCASSLWLWLRLMSLLRQQKVTTTGRQLEAAEAGENTTAVVHLSAP